MRRAAVFFLWIVLSFAPTTLRAQNIPLPAPIIPEGFGVNIHFTDPQPGEMELLARSGLRWIRMDLSWTGTEPKPGQYDFSPYDRLLAQLEARGLRAIFILDYGN